MERVRRSRLTHIHTHVLQILPKSTEGRLETHRHVWGRSARLISGFGGEAAVSDTAAKTGRNKTQMVNRCICFQPPDQSVPTDPQQRRDYCDLSELMFANGRVEGDAGGAVSPHHVSGAEKVTGKHEDPI